MGRKKEWNDSEIRERERERRNFVRNRGRIIEQKRNYKVTGGVGSRVITKRGVCLPAISPVAISASKYYQQRATVEKKARRYESASRPHGIGRPLLDDAPNARRRNVFEINAASGTKPPRASYQLALGVLFINQLPPRVVGGIVALRGFQFFRRCLSPRVSLPRSARWNARFVLSLNSSRETLARRRREKLERVGGCHRNLIERVRFKFVSI